MPESQFLRYVEATYAALSMLNVAFFIGVLVKTPFHYGCKWDFLGYSFSRLLSDKRESIVNWEKPPSRFNIR